MNVVINSQGTFYEAFLLLSTLFMEHPYLRMTTGLD
jgi:hypothetical protein